jgi:hypothetical protein
MNNARRTAERGLRQGRERSVVFPRQSKGSRDPRRSETERTAFKMMRCGLSGQNLRQALIAHNARRTDRLPVDDTVAWALKMHREARHGR